MLKILLLFMVILSSSIVSAQIKDVERKPPVSFKKGNHQVHNPYDSKTDLWPKVYFPGKTLGGLDVTESYDSGYLITGTFVNNYGTFTSGIILKTDVNGNALWQRHILTPENNFNVASRTYNTLDGGSVSTGMTTVVDNCQSYDCQDAWVIKLDACGNKQWCNIYSVPFDLDYGVDVVQLSNGNIILLINYYGYDSVEERIWLFCLSSEGQTLWQKVFITSEHPLWTTNPSGYGLFKDDEENMLMTGECWVCDDLNPTWSHVQLLNVKFSPEGDEIWGKPWYSEYDTVPRFGYKAILSPNGSYHIGGTGPIPSIHTNGPAVFRMNKNGDVLSEITYPLGINPYHGGGGNGGGLEFTSSNQMIIASQYWENVGLIPGHNLAILSDTLGNLLKEKFQFDDLNSIMGVAKTSDNHVLMTAGFWATPDSLKMFLYKYTPELEYPPIDTRPLVYDYLCPEAVKPMDTIVPDCDIIVGMEEPMHQAERYSLVASPNPASEQLTLTLPDRMMKEWESNGLSSRTLYYTLPDNLQLQFTDALGRMHQTLAVAKGTRQVTVDVSRWPAGVYLARLTGGSTVVADVKVVVR